MFYFYAGLFAPPIAETYSIWFGGVAGAVALGVIYILMKKGIAQPNVGTFSHTQMVIRCVSSLFCL